VSRLDRRIQLVRLENIDFIFYSSILYPRSNSPPRATSGSRRPLFASLPAVGPTILFADGSSAVLNAAASSGTVAVASVLAGEMPPAGTNRASSATERSFTFREATHTWTMWVLLIAVVFGSYSLNTNSIVMVPYFEEKGFSSGVAASALSVYGLASVATRLGWGYLADRFTVRPALVAQASLTGLGAILLLQVDSRESLYAISALEGVLMSGFATLSSLLWPTFFGRRHLGSIVGLTQMFTPLSSAAGPLIAGLIHDHVSMTALVAPTVNAYKRLRPGALNGFYANWGLDHRGVAVRVPPTEVPYR